LKKLPLVTSGHRGQRPTSSIHRWWWLWCGHAKTRLQLDQR